MGETRRRLVVVGNGMVAATFLEQLAGAGRESHDVTVFGAEPHPAYDRIKLSSVLAGQCEPEALTLLDEDWYADHGVTLRAGREVVAVDRERRVVRDCTGAETPYDVCVLATGSDPLVPPIEGSHRGGVHTFRTLRDVDDIVEAGERSSSAVVIGGGLLGLEAAYGLHQRGVAVSVVHLVDRLMERQLDPVGAGVLRRELERMGMRIVLPAETASILGNGRVEAIALRDGRILDADLVVIACGIRPSTGLARDCGLEVGRGIIVDDQLRTSDPDVFAIGECTEHRGLLYGIVAPLNQQARVLAAHLHGDESAAFAGGIPATTLKVAGVHVFSAGAIDTETGDDLLTLEDTSSGVYKRVLLRGQLLRGAILVGDLSTAPQITAVIAAGAQVNGNRLGLVAAPTGEAPQSVAEGLPDDAVVCGCNGITKAQIVGAIREQGLTSRAEVTRCTRAAGSCGSCAAIVDGLLAGCGVEASSSSAEPPVCACVPLGLHALRDEIRARNLRSVQAVLETLGNGTGCAKCKIALSYHLDAWWCGDYEEDRSARFINDRVHANIQRDGTFSVVPRMFGGITTPGELRRIADVADRYAVPMVKVTGGQRLDLLGVRKEDLPSIWRDLGIVSGHAYGKCIRTVKTCVGSDFCRFGVGDSTALGIAFERMVWGLYTPHKLKSGVTGCPRNCAEVTVKDVGLVGIATGWEVYVGGAAGMSVRKGDLLSTVATPEEALRHVALFIQHYREEARYLERTYHYLVRVGVEAVRAATVDAPEADQLGLLERFALSKSRVKEPWSTEGAAPRTANQFGALPAAGPEEAELVGQRADLLPAYRSHEAFGRGDAMLAASGVGVE
ncbi:MAG TPA: nitrite reductase large subunit NirB [Candidatus Dormibacteraeota bacterium]|nr:nitrite reductase large subunit NirB [Candidatus Dormibacteraeota bacterium]